MQKGGEYRREYDGRGREGGTIQKKGIIEVRDDIEIRTL